MTEWQDNHEQHLKALAIMDDLHRAGFTGLWLDSKTIFRDGRVSGGKPGQKEKRYEHLTVVIDQTSLGSDEMVEIIGIAGEHDARIILDEIRMNQQQFSRLAIWPSAD